MGRGLFFFSRAHVHTPVLYLGNHQCDYVQISYRYGYRVGSWVGVVVGVDAVVVVDVVVGVVVVQW